MINKRFRIPAVLKYVSMLFILFLGAFLLSANEKSEQVGSLSRAEISENPQAEKDSKDVSPHSSAPNCTAVWLAAIDLGSSSVKQCYQKHEKTPGFARLCYTKQEFNFADSENTIAQVNSELANLFTLIGEKPSGTS